MPKTKIEAVVIDGNPKKKTRKTILIDSGNGPLDCRMSEVLPGYRVLGVFFYPSLCTIAVHVTKC